MATLPAPSQTASQDDVGIFTQDFKQVFSYARPIKATIKPIKKAMEHPIESGAVITDHVILMPIEIEIPMIVPSGSVQDMYQQINQYYMNSTLLIVQTRSSVYVNQYIAEIPHDENNDQWDTIEITIKLKQAQVVNSQGVTIQVKKPSNNSTVDRGTQQGQVPKISPQRSVLAGLFGTAR